MWLPDEETLAAVLTALARLAPVKAIVKSPSKKQRPFNAECNEIISNATNIVLVSWLPQVSYGGGGAALSMLKHT